MRLIFLAFCFSAILTSSGASGQNTNEWPCFHGADTRTGKLLWKVDFKNERELNLTDAISFNDYVFITSGYGKGCLLFKLKETGKGSVTFADGMLYMLDERGTMRLVNAIPDKFEESGEFKVPKGGESMYWAHPVVCGGRLYIRHADKILVYNIRQ